MANLMDLEMDDLNIMRVSLLQRLNTYPTLEKTEEQRTESATIGRLLPKVDKAMDDAFEENRALIEAGNQLHFENVRGGK